MEHSPTWERFLQFPSSVQQELLDFCIGNHGLRITYDPVFRRVFHPTNHKERWESLLSSILNRNVNISPVAFHSIPNQFIHKRTASFDTGIYPNNAGLHEDIFICLDIFRSNVHTITKRSSLQEAWLTFLSATDISSITALTSVFPMFLPLYQEITDFAQNPKELMNMFSEALYMMDRNMERLMVEELREEVKIQAEAHAKVQAEIQAELQNTKNKAEIFRLRLLGKPSGEIAKELAISPNKVEEVLGSLTE